MRRILHVKPSFPFGRQKVDKIAPSTGIFGKRVSGSPPSNATRARKGGKR